MGRIAKLFAPLLDGPKVEPRASQVTPWGAWQNNYNTGAGIAVTDTSALQLLAVYGCVQLIADTIATLPQHCYRKTDGTGQEIPNPAWIDQPNPETSSVDFLTQTLISLLLDGNAYWTVATDRAFVTSELYCIDPCTVTIRQENGRVVYYIQGQRYTNRLLHIRGLTKAGQLKGLSPLEAARQGVGVGLAAQEFASSFYRNGTSLSGVISMQGQMNPDERRMLREEWGRMYGGASNAHLPAVLTGAAEWKPLSVTPEQAQFLETRGYSAAEISAFMFLVHPSHWGLSFPNAGSDITYQNIEQRGTGLTQFSLLRWIVRLDKAFTALLPRPQYHKFNVDGLQRADIKTRYEIGQIGVSSGLILKEEWRIREDLPVDPATMFQLESQSRPLPVEQEVMNSEP